MIAELERRPILAVTEAPRREPPPGAVARIQDELGVRKQPRLASYGPTSHLTEELLFRGYRHATEETS